MNSVCTASRHKKQQAAVLGFSLIELLIAIVITAIVGGAIVSNYIVQQRAATRVRQMAHMQQQIRGAITVMSEDIRLAGLNRDPDDADSPFGIRSIGGLPIEDGDGISLTDQGYPSLTLGYDYNRLRPNIEENSRYDKNYPGSEPSTMNGKEDEPFYQYRLFNQDNDGTLELARYVYDAGDVDRQLLAENIEAIAFAYALDADEDGVLDFTTKSESGKPSIIWAADIDGDGEFDINLDTNGNNFITRDDAGGDGEIEVGDGPAGDLSDIYTSFPPPTAIRAVRIWLLACTGPAQNYRDQNTYLVGHRIINPQESDGEFPVNRRRVVMEHFVNCRNMWPTKHM